MVSLKKVPKRIAEKTAIFFAPSAGLIGGICLLSLVSPQKASAEERHAKVSPSTQTWMANVASCCSNPHQTGACSEDGIPMAGGAMPSPIPAPSFAPPRPEEASSESSGGGGTNRDYASCICKNLKGNKEIGNQIGELVHYCQVLE